MSIKAFTLQRFAEMATHINIPLKHYRAELFMEIKNFDQFNWWILFPLRILLYSALVVYIYELWSKIVWLGFVCCFRNKLTTLIKFGMGFYFVDFNPEWILLLLQYIGIIISHTYFSGQCLKCLFSKRWKVCYR